MCVTSVFSPPNLQPEKQRERTARLCQSIPLDEKTRKFMVRQQRLLVEGGMLQVEAGQVLQGLETAQNVEAGNEVAAHLEVTIQHTTKRKAVNGK